MSILSFLGWGKKSIEVDLTTPEGAILSLEDAYRRADIERAVACKDFQQEAAYTVRGKPQMQDEEILARLAENLESEYRAKMKDGFPVMTGVTSTFPKTQDFGGGKVVVTEVCHYPDGGKSRHDMLVTKTDSGWKVIIQLK